MEFEKLADDRTGERAEAVRERVESARSLQRQRFEGTDLTSNADMGPARCAGIVSLISLAALVRQAMTQLQLTARAFHRVLKLSRTIADLAGEHDIASAHVAEALQYRPRLWG